MAADCWFIYALGSGWGHLNRALAFAQVAAKHRSVHVLTNSPYAQRLVPIVQTTTLTIHQLPAVESLADARQFVQSLLRSIPYNCLVVDTFPRGLIGELTEIVSEQNHPCRILIHRDLNPAYVAAKSLTSFVRSHYSGLLIPGEPAVPFAELPQAKQTAPWLSRDQTDLVTADGVRSRLNIPAHKPLIIICGAGQPTELAFFGTLTEQIAAAFPFSTVRCLSAICPPTCAADKWLYHWPGMDILQLATVVVGSGGYNLTHECSALGVPLVAFALPRLYDRQALRIQKCGHLVESAGEAIATVEPLLNRPKANAPDYVNGVHEAIAHIKTWLKSERSQC